ncbi:MAG: DUF5658 family protein [Chloroflexota bacterium]
MWAHLIKYRSSIFLWVLLNILDMSATLILLNLGASEVFPVSRTLIGIGTAPFAVFKIAVPLSVPLLLYVMGTLRLLKILNIAMSVIVTVGTLAIIATSWLSI